jgi:hypothetical protein
LTKAKPVPAFCFRLHVQLRDAAKPVPLAADIPI